MKHTEKIALFDTEIAYEIIIEEVDHFILTQEPLDDNIFEYKVFDNFDILVRKWGTKEDCLSMKYSDYKRSSVRKVFVEIIRQEKIKKKQHRFLQKINNIKDKTDDKDKVENNDEYSLFGYSSLSKYTEPEKSTGFLDKLNKSDTLVIHCLDNTTNMLSQIYEGKNWDVLRDGNIDKEELHQLIESHDKIICLGHGTPSGLINVQGGGYIIGDREAKYLKGKKLFMIWCHASSFAIRHGLHGFITGNMPSDAWEARSVGFNVAQKYMDDNITFWSKCCAKYVNQALNGNAEGASANIRKEYLAVYGDEDKWNDQEIGITKYNAERTIAI